MNKSEIGDYLADGFGWGKTVAKHSVDSVFEAIGEALASGEEVGLAGFGTLFARSRPARTGRNSQTGYVLSIPASRTPSFKAGKALNEEVKDG